MPRSGVLAQEADPARRDRHAAVTARAKTLGSFLEKIERKGYKHPFDETKDFAGVRLVCLYRSSLELVGRIVRSEFEVLAEENKAEALGGDRFGYGAWHFIVRLGQRNAGSSVRRVQGTGL